MASDNSLPRFAKSASGLTGTSTSRLQEHLAKLETFRGLAPGWDSYAAPPPSETALRNAREILRFLDQQDGAPNVRLTPCAEGGVTIVLGNRLRYADIECFNDGEILAITSRPEQEPALWSVELGPDGLRSTLERIQSFLNA